MNDPNKTRPAFNPPLRIFTVPEPNGNAVQPVRSFQRPQLRRFVQNDRVARYFNRRGPSVASRLD